MDLSTGVSQRFPNPSCVRPSISLIIKISADVVCNSYTLIVRNYNLPECCKILSGQKGALLYSPVGSIVRPAELYSPSAEKLHE